MFFYYLFAGGSCLASVAGFYFLYDRNHAEKLFYDVTWSTFHIYANLEDFYDNNIEPCIKLLLDEEQSGDENIKIIEKFTIRNTSTNDYETVIEIPKKDNYDWGFVTKKVKEINRCKIYENINERDDDEFVIVEKPFLQVELEQNNEKMEIHQNLHYFFLKGNKIFDKNFMKWYMKYWFKKDLEENYKLHIIDNSVNIFTIDHNQYIILGEKDYDIKKVI
jgi:hypothetical protein